MVTSTIHQLPEGSSPFGTGEVFVAVIPEDVLTCYGNVVVEAGSYEAQRSDGGGGAAPGSITLWSHAYYAQGDRGGGWVGIPSHQWHLPGEEPRQVPEHFCWDHARSGVVAEDHVAYCGLCGVDLG